VEVRRAAAGALAQLGPLCKEALPELEAAVNDKDKNVRCSAIYALGGLGKDAAKTVPLLAKCLRENIVEVRLAAIRSLGNVGPDVKNHKDAVSLLRAAARESQTDIREGALDALKKIELPQGTAEKP
jgi:HEAT repeat protein